MPDEGRVPATYTARPKLLVDEREEAGLSESMVGLVVEETTSGLYRCEATFANWGPSRGTVGFLHFDRSLLDFGKAIKVKTGAGDSEGQVFEGRITGIEGRFTGERPPEILILAEDRLQDLRMSRRTRSFEDISDADLFRQVAGQHGLQAQVDLTGPTHKVLAQVNQSDLALLRERARSIDAELWVEGGTLHARPRPRREAGDLTLTFGTGLFEFSVLADVSGQASGFTVAGWDVSAKQSLSERAAAAALNGELESDVGGSQVLEDAFGVREQRIVHRLPSTTEEARSLAEAYYRRTARRFVVGTGVAEGDARLKVGVRLDLRGLGPMFDGKYTVTRARHQFNAQSGYRTRIDVERPGIGRGDS